MIDYILNFPDEATAQAALADWRYTDEETNTSGWAPKSKCGVIEIKVILQKAVWDNSDIESPILVTPQALSSGFWMAIAMPNVDDAFWAMPFVVSEHDRQMAKNGLEHTLRTKLAPEQIAGVKAIEPTFAGSNYPFGAG